MTTHTKIPVFLTRHEYERLRDATHDSQLALLDKVLLHSLEVLADILRGIPAGEGKGSLFDEKIQLLYEGLKRLKGIPDLYPQEAALYRNSAVTTFVYYRILYAGTYEAYSKHHQDKPYFEEDSHILFKRIPYQLYDYLGSEYWRLYELYEAVEGSLSVLKLNADIREFIVMGSSGLLAMPNILPGEKINCETSPIDQQQLPEKELTELRQGFTHWLQGKMADPEVKGIFTLSVKYGSDVFIAEQILFEYTQFYPVSINALKQALSMPGKKYKIDNEAVFRVQGIKLDNEYEPQQIEEEEDHGNNQNS
jgi:hypothetical protein